MQEMLAETSRVQLKVAYGREGLSGGAGAPAHAFPARPSEMRGGARVSPHSRSLSIPPELHELHDLFGPPRLVC
jgi:hypothetical protein